MTNKCYYCGAIKTSVEHIPAKSLLNGCSGLNLLTVPSCSEHNNAKSDLDEQLGLILIKPTISGYQLYTPNPEKSPDRNLKTKNRIKAIYQNNLFNSDEFKYKNGVIEVTSPLLLKNILKYFEYMLAGCYYDYAEMRYQLPNEYHCVSLSIFHFVDYPPNVFSSPNDRSDYSVLSSLRINSYICHEKLQNSKFKYEIRRFYPLASLNINLDNGETIDVCHNDLVIIATLHSTIVVCGIFSKQKKKFISINVIQSILKQKYTSLILPYNSRKSIISSYHQFIK